MSGVKLNYGWSEEDLIKEQKEEDEMNAVREYAAGLSSYFPWKIKVNRNNFVLEEDVLYLKENKGEGRMWYRVVLPSSMVPRALSALHSSPLAGHFGVERTYHRAREAFFWTGMRGDIKIYVLSCNGVCVINHIAE